MMKNRINKLSYALKGLSATLLITAVLAVPTAEASAAGLQKWGCRGTEVTHLQQELLNRGCFTHWRATGYFGRKTRQSVVNFQKANGLVPDGIVGPKTNAALYGKKAPAKNVATSKKTNGDIYWLSRIIHAEAQGESYAGKVAVGNVIMNRLNVSEFPNSIYQIIFDSYKGIPQFSPVADGTIYNTPDNASVRAAKEAYAGSRPVGDSLYFFNPKKAAGSWIVRNKQCTGTIGNHSFYR
ncbi:cell wall hydrolase [Eubacteriales bacterium mix99]|jgi:N-acetylmuramoyl-L-alanine amidase